MSIALMYNVHICPFTFTPAPFSSNLSLYFLHLFHSECLGKMFMTIFGLYYSTHERRVCQREREMFLFSLVFRPEITIVSAEPMDSAANNLSKHSQQKTVSILCLDAELLCYVHVQWNITEL